MTEPRLNVTQSKSPYTHSQDFLNIEEPPAAKQTPDVSEFDLTNDGAPRSFQRGYMNYNDSGRLQYGSGQAAGSFQAANRGARRRSSNYIDALNQEMSERTKTAENEDPFFSRRKSLSPGMDSQDTRHDVESKMLGNDSDRYSTVSMGDSFEKIEKEKPPSLFKGSYTSDEKDVQPGFFENRDDRYSYGVASIGNNDQRPNVNRRKSSFAYEDYKKDIYNRLNMFNKE